VRVPPVEKQRRSLGIRGWLIGAAVVIVILLLSARGLARIYTDYLWFDEVHFGNTWRGLIEAKAFPALIFSLIFFVLGTIVQEFYRGVRARQAMVGEGALQALGRLVGKNRRRYGGYVVHVAIG